MKYVGVDLHKQTITIATMVKVEQGRKFLSTKKLHCSQPERIREYFEELGEFQVVVEATANYEWFFLLIEDLADRCVLAHPKKMRIIAESTRKTDKIDARVLAQFLAIDMIPEAYRPTPRIREHRVLTRHRHWLQGRITSLKTKIRAKLAHYNADIAGLFTEEGQEYLDSFPFKAADRFEVEQLVEQLELCQKQLKKAEAELKKFAQTAAPVEREARAVLNTIPQVGAVTIDVVLSELGDWRRFRNAKQVVSFAGLDPGYRESADKGKQLHVSKEGSKLLRWAMIEAAWRLQCSSFRWRAIFYRLLNRTGSRKKAIVGVARRLLCVIFAMLRDGTAYRYPAAQAAA